jgi:hypothetical protein
VFIVVIAVATCGGVLAFAWPTGSAPPPEKVVDVSKGPLFAAPQVARAFAAHGIRLARTSGRIPGSASYTDVHPGSKLDDGFLVTVWKPTVKVLVSTSGPKPLYETWIGNVDVSYGGLSQKFAARVAAAVDDLTP